MPKGAVPFEEELSAAVDGQKRFLEQLRAIVADEVDRKLKPIAADAKAARKAVELLAQQVESTNTILAGMQANIAMTVGWITKRGLKEDALEAKLDKYFENFTPKLPDPTPPRGEPL